MGILKKIKINTFFKSISVIVVTVFIAFAIVSFNVKKQVNNHDIVSSEIFNNYILFTVSVLFLLFLLFLCTLAFIRRITYTDIPYMIGWVKKISDFRHNEYDSINYKPYFKEEKELEKFIKNISEEKVFLEQIRNIASKEYVLDDVLDKVFEKLNDFISVDRIGVAFIDYDNKQIIAETGKMSYGDILLGPGFKVDMENTSLTEIIKSKKPIYINDISKELKTKKHKNKSLELILKEKINSNMILPLILEDKVFGFLFFSSFEKGTYNKRTLKIGQKIATEIAAIVDQTYLTKNILNNVTLSFAELVEQKDNDTGNHINRMTKYSKVIANALINYENKDYNVNNSFVREIELYAPLHDIGKIGVPDNVLCKPGKLTSDEWLIMKEHTNIGGDILNNLSNRLKVFRKDFYKIAINITKHHHEKWDGTGYPCGLKGKEIPLEARIVAIADVFDALSSKRAYKEPMPFNKVVEIIKDGSGRHFDPELVYVFFNNIDKIKKIYNKDFKDNKTKTAQAV